MQNNMGSDLPYGYNVSQLGLHIPVHPCHLSITGSKAGEVAVPGAQKQLHCTRSAYLSILAFASIAHDSVGEIDD
jgi:hypothetical protein